MKGGNICFFENVVGGGFVPWDNVEMININDENERLPFGLWFLRNMSNNVCANSNILTNATGKKFEGGRGAYETDTHASACYKCACQKNPHTCC
jgi:hypothetical protein